jgi:hypothetical protein
MIHKRTFIVNQSGSFVKERIGNFFRAAGYRELSPMNFQRGSLIGTLTALSPRKWQVNALVETEPAGENRTDVRLKLNVNTTGHIVLPKEVDYWLSEMENFEQSVTSGEIQAESLNKSAGTVKHSVIKGFLIFLLAAVFVGVPAGVLLGVIVPRSAGIGVFIGIAAGTIAARKHWGF